MLHLVTCAKGAEYAYNFGNAARYESVEEARRMDDRTLRAWSAHPRLYVIDNSVDFEEKINRAIAQICRIVGQSAPAAAKRKYLIHMPDCAKLQERYGAVPVEMMQTYLNSNSLSIERRIRQQKNGGGYLYFYTEKRVAEDGTRWVTEKPISEKEYVAYLMESDLSLHAVRKVKYRFGYQNSRLEIDVYPFDQEKAILFVYGGGQTPELPEEIRLIKEVTGLADYKNRQLAASQIL